MKMAGVSPCAGAPRISAKNPAPTSTRPMPNLNAADGSSPRFASVIHRKPNTGASAMLPKYLTDWYADAGMVQPSLVPSTEASV